MPTEIDELADLLADAQRMPAAMLPRPRTPEPPDSERRVVDLTAVEVPASVAALVDGYGDYGA